MKSNSFDALGPSIANYYDRKLHWKDFIFLFIPACLAVLTPLAYGIWRTLYGQMNYGLIPAETWGKSWFSLAALALIPLLILAIWRIKRAHRNVSIHKNGLHISGMGNHTLMWSQITGISSSTIHYTFLGNVIGSRLRTKVYLSNHRSIRIEDRIKNLPELSLRIKARIYPRLLPKFRLALSERKTVSFGPLSIDDQFLHLNKQKIPWEMVKKINVQSGQLVVQVINRKPKMISVGKIPNLELFIQLINEGAVG